MQSFVTGVLYVALDLRPDTPIVLRGLDRSVPELPTIPTDIEVWTAKLERFAARIGRSRSQDLFRNTNAAIGDARTLVRRVDAQIDPPSRSSRAHSPASTPAWTRPKARPRRGRPRRPLATQAEATLKAAQRRSATAPAIEDLRRLAAKLDAQADPLLTSIRSTSDTARATMEARSSHSAAWTRRSIRSRPGLRVFQTLKELRAAAQALRSLADYLERVPDAPVYGVRRPVQTARRETASDQGPPVDRSKPAHAGRVDRSRELRRQRSDAVLHPRPTAAPRASTASASIAMSRWRGPARRHRRRAVTMPGYLDRNQIVIRTGTDQVEISAFHRWAEPLEDGIARVLAEEIGARVPTERIVIFPWRGVVARTIQYRSSSRCCVRRPARRRRHAGHALADSGPTARSWRPAIHGDRGRGGPGYEPMVAAMDRALGTLGQEIATEIRAMPRDEEARR